MLKVENLHAEIDDKAILKGLDLEVKAGEIHAIMGPNGAGKSTLSNVIAGRPGYEMTDGSIRLDGTDLAELEPEERSHEGVFLAFQYPVEIPGVSNMEFLKAAIESRAEAAGVEPMDTVSLMKRAREVCGEVGLPADFLKRGVNEGFSGGERKRNEILQMMMLEPKLCLLDETDSGLDIDALQVVAKGVNSMRSPDRGMIVVTHYQRLLDYIVPDFVHVLANGRIVKSGGSELALELEQKGYGWIDEGRLMNNDFYRHIVDSAPNKAAIAPLALPEKRNEIWRYTNLNNLYGKRFAVGSHSAASPRSISSYACKAHIVDGQLELPRAPAFTLSTVDGDSLDPRAADWIATWNSGYISQTCCFEVSADCALELAHLQSAANAQAHDRILIKVAPGVSFKLIETFAGQAQAASTSVLEIHLAQGAEVEHLQMCNAEPEHFRFGAVTAKLESEANYRFNSFSPGLATHRQSIRVVLGGEHAHADVNGVFLAGGQTQVDTRLEVEHAVPNCTSTETWRGLAGGSGKASFVGRIHIHKDAQKSDAQLSSRNLLLSNTAELNTKPELEIYADDVICAHGATVGQLDPDQLYYLRSRGISPQRAKQILTFAFINELIMQVGDESAREAVDQCIRSAFSSLSD